MTSIVALYRDAFRGLSREVWLLSFVLFVNRCGTMVLPFLVLYLTTQQGFSESEAGVVLALYGVGAMCGIALGGWLTDRLGYRPVMLASMGLSGLGFIAFGFLRSSAALHVGAVVLGLLGEAFRPANGAAVAVFSAPAQRARAFGLNRLALNLGFTVGPALGGFLAGFDYGWLFWLDGLTCLVAAGLLARALPSSAEAPAGQEGDVRPASDLDSEARTEAIRYPWQDGLFRTVFLLIFAHEIVFFQIQSTYPLYLSEVRGLSTAWIGSLFAVNTVIIVAFEMLLVKRLEAARPFVVIGVAGLFVGLGFGLLPLFESLPGIILLVGVWTVGEMLLAPISMAWVSDRADERCRGAYLAAFGMTYSISSALAPLLGTWVYEHQGPDQVWWWSLAIGLFSMVAFLALERATGRDRRIRA